MAQAKQYVLMTHDPQKTAHFRKVASVLHRGTWVECDEKRNQLGGHIWLAEFWDRG